MAYIFVSDGLPEAEEYQTSYLWFDERDPESRRRALERADGLRRRGAAARLHALGDTWPHLLGSAETPRGAAPPRPRDA